MELHRKHNFFLKRSYGGGGLSDALSGNEELIANRTVAVASHRVYYKGGRWWLPPSPGCGESCVSVLPMAHPSTKGAPTMH